MVGSTVRVSHLDSMQRPLPAAVCGPWDSVTWLGAEGRGSKPGQQALLRPPVCRPGARCRGPSGEQDQAVAMRLSSGGES